MKRNTLLIAAVTLSLTSSCLGFGLGYGTSGYKQSTTALIGSVVNGKETWRLSILHANLPRADCRFYDLSCFASSPHLIHLFELTRNNEIILTIKPDGSLARKNGRTIDEDVIAFWWTLSVLARNMYFENLDPSAKKLNTNLFSSKIGTAASKKPLDISTAARYNEYQ